MSPSKNAVLVTRPTFFAETSAAIEARGYRAVLAPLLTVRHFPTPMPARAQAILVTSSNALAALTPVALPLLAVGDATADRARQAGFANVRSAGGDADALVALAARLCDPVRGPLVLVAGAGQGFAAAAALRARNYRVVRRVGYAARPVRRFPEPATAPLRSGEVHAVLFLSAETAGAFVRLLPPALHPCLSGVAALAIGPAAARVLEKLPWHHVCAARTPTLDDVLALL